MAALGTIVAAIAANRINFFIVILLSREVLKAPRHMVAHPSPSCCTSAMNRFGITQSPAGKIAAHAKRPPDFSGGLRSSLG